jgi:hypothetical protein
VDTLEVELTSEVKGKSSVSDIIGECSACRLIII